MSSASRRSIHIERITVRLSGVAAETGREAAEGLGQALSAALAEQLAGARRSLRISEIHASIVPPTAPRTSDQLRAAIVDGVASSLAEQ
jgi:hypothetical protein